MVRNNSSSRVQRISSSSRRRTAKRPSFVRQSSASGYLPRGRLAQAQVNVQREYTNLLKTISNLTNINDINKVLSNASSSLSLQVAQIKQSISRGQSETIAQLRTYFSKKREQEKKYDRKLDKAKTGEQKDSAKVKINELQEEMRALGDILLQMGRGNIYDYKTVTSYVDRLGRYERESQQGRFDKRRFEKEANQTALNKIKELGYNPVIQNGKLVGYNVGVGTGKQEYRFNKQGNSYFYKSNIFKPVFSGGAVTGYIDTVRKMSIPIATLPAHVKDIRISNQRDEAKYNQSLKEFNTFQLALKTIRLPTGYSFERDTKGNIVSIDDKSRGVNLPLGALPQVTNSWVFNQTLKRYYKTSAKDVVNAYQSLKDPLYTRELKWYKKFTPKNVQDYTDSRRYNYYKSTLNGKLSMVEFVNSYPTGILDKKWKKFATTQEGKKVAKSLEFSIRDNIRNPSKYGTTTRVKGLLVAGSLVGLPSAGLILFGSSYLSVLNLGKEVSQAPLPKDFQATAKIVAKSFGMGALEGLLYGTAFKFGGKILAKTGKPLLKITFTPKYAKLIDLRTQKAIQRGLSILGVTYVSTLAGRTTYNIKNIVVGDAETGTKGLSKEVGILVGFAVPLLASKILNKPIANTQKTITELEKLRQGQLNNAYLKAKNSQPSNPIRGKVISKGKVKIMNKEVINNVYKKAKVKLDAQGISKNEFLDASLYHQSMKVKSNAPKTEAIIKLLKAKMSGKTIRKDGYFKDEFRKNFRKPLRIIAKKIPDHIEFKRNGIVISKINKAGKVFSFAVEFNLNGNKISNVGFKTGIGMGKYAKVTTLTRARAVKGKPLRVKYKDIYIIKGKIKTSEDKLNGIVKILNTLETKKVFFNRKQLNKNELVTLKGALKKDLAISRDTTLERTLAKLFKNKRITSTSGYSNVLRIQRSKDSVNFVTRKVKGIKQTDMKVGEKGEYLELGLTKFKIPSVNRIKINNINIKIVQRPTKLSPAKVVKLYHGTTKNNVNSILKEGIKTTYTRGMPKKNADLYLTNSRAMAMAYTGKGGKVFEVRLTQQEFKRLLSFGYGTLRGKSGMIYSSSKGISPSKIQIARPLLKVTKYKAPEGTYTRRPTPRRTAPVKINKQIQPVNVQRSKIKTIPLKRNIKVSEVRRVEDAIKTIQVITKPIVRLSRPISVSVMRQLSRSIGALALASATEQRTELKTLQSVLNKTITAQKNISSLKQVQLIIRVMKSQTKLITQLQSIRIAPATIIPIKPVRGRRIKTPKKPPVIIPIPKQNDRMKRRVKKGLETGFVSSYYRGRRTSSINSIPITKERAFDILAYSLKKYKLSKGLISRSPKKVERAILKRSIGKVPSKYFVRNRSKFIVKKLRTKQESYEVYRK